MDRTTQEALIGRIMTDQKFREAFFSDPEGTLRCNGYPVLDEVVQAVKGADVDSVHQMAAQFESKSLQGSST